MLITSKPKIMNDFSKCVIYMIFCKDEKIKDVYISSSTNFLAIKSCHKSSCNNIHNKQYHSYLYNFIRENGGWDNWDCKIYEDYPCDNKHESKQRIKEISKNFSIISNKKEE